MTVTAYPMTAPLWGLAILTLWTILMACLLLAVRMSMIAKGHDVAELAKPNEASLLWRLTRVQFSMMESLPLFLSVCVLLTLRGANTFSVALLITIYVIARIFHSVAHILGLKPVLRLYSQLLQLVLLVLLAICAVI